MELHDPLVARCGLRLIVKRDDLIHPLVSGNKWRKLRDNLTAARAQGQRRLLTFGGAYSNHLFATASAGRLWGFDTVGVVRGEPCLPLNPVLSHAVSCGMRLHYLDRSTYRRKDAADVLASLRARFGDFLMIPEGGSNAAGVAGCREIAKELDVQLDGDYDAVVCACGTGTTLAGIASALAPDMLALGVSVLRGHSGLEAEVRRLMRALAADAGAPWRIEHGYHHGGYAKSTPELLAFVRAFQDRHGMPIEPVYTGKMFFGLYQLIEAGTFPRGSTVVAVHTGGVHPSLVKT